MLNNEEMRERSCADMAEDISAYLDGELNEEKAAHLRKHLQKCESCASLYNDLKDISKNISGMGIEYPAELHSSIMNRVEEEKRAERKEGISFSAKVRRWGMIFGASAAAVICLAVLGGPIFRGQKDLTMGGSDYYVADEAEAVEYAADMNKSLTYKEELEGVAGQSYGVAAEMQSPNELDDGDYADVENDAPKNSVELTDSVEENEKITADDVSFGYWKEPLPIGEEEKALDFIFPRDRSRLS